MQADAVETVTILGTGPAGLTAAIYCARANLKPLCIEGEQPGGQLTITSDVENYPGFPEAISGPELMERFRKQAERFGTRFVGGNLQSVHLKTRPFELVLSDGTKILTKILIIATGASARWLGLPNEKKYRGKGVSACATCDGFFFRNLDIAVVGGGDTALEEANFLTRFAKSVTLIHRRDKFRASQAMQDRTFKNPKIKVAWNSVIEEIVGDKDLTGIKLKNMVSGKTEDLAVKGLFIAIGHQPNTEVFKGQLPMNAEGYLESEGRSTKTQVPGVFVAGDVADHYYRQAISAAGTGCMAAIDAERFLESEGI